MLRMRLRGRRRQCRPSQIRLRTRELHSTDGAALQAVFTGMSPNSRYQRFHTSTSRLTAAMRRHLLDVDEVRHRALVAEVNDDNGWQPVGIARYIRQPGTPTEAEAALEVVDDWQDRGVGLLLLRALVADARETGVRTLVGDVLPGNSRVVGLLRKHFPPPAISWRDGTLRIAVATSW